MHLTRKECDYYDGLESLNVSYPLRYLAKHLDDPDSGGRNCPSLASDDESALLSLQGMRYLRNKWAMRICGMYLEEQDNSRREDFEKFLLGNKAAGFVEAVSAWHAARTLGISQEPRAPFLAQMEQQELKMLVIRWAYREACEFGDYFDEFHLRYAADMDFPTLVISYIAYLPYSWLAAGGKEREPSAPDHFWIRGKATRESGGKLIFSPLDHPEIRLNIACSYPDEDYRGISPFDERITDKDCLLRVSYGGVTGENNVILNAWDDDADGGAGQIVLTPYDMCRLVADTE